MNFKSISFMNFLIRTVILASETHACFTTISQLLIVFNETHNRQHVYNYLDTPLRVVFFLCSALLC